MKWVESSFGRIGLSVVIGVFCGEWLWVDIILDECILFKLYGWGVGMFYMDSLLCIGNFIC